MDDYYRLCDLWAKEEARTHHNADDYVWRVLLRYAAILKAERDKARTETHEARIEGEYLRKYAHDPHGRSLSGWEFIWERNH